jgi:hypothetical protein
VVRLGRTKQEERERFAKYRAVGRGLLATARDLESMGDAKYGNGLAIIAIIAMIAIHAAIAYTDALTVAYREIRSTDGEHTRAAEVLVHALGHRADAEQVRRLRRIPGAKTHASYSGSYYTIDDGRAMLLELEHFARWAEDRLTDRTLG